MRRRLVLLVLVLLAGLAGGACGSDSESASSDAAPGSRDAVTASADPAVTPDPGTTPASPTTTEWPRYSELPTVTLGELPPEALDTLRLIRDGGPFPYDQDGSTFQNREGLLPDYEVGFYAEYTVETPGLSHRGARRFVVGDDGAIYWTDDHYASFEELIAG